MNTSLYPYRFVQKVTIPRNVPDGFLLYRLLYSFKSPISHQTYWVWVEVYKHNFYAVKFHLKAHRHSPYKYNIMTGLNEPRRCIKTCMAIMFEIAESNPKASFGFIGANMTGESETYTKRFRVYERFMTTFFSSAEYLHKVNYAKSAYILLNKKEQAANPHLLDDITEGFKVLYPYFD